MPLVDLLIPPREKDLGGFSVHRILPYAQQRMVGPFIFLDHMGPAHFAANEGINVRPHPHIGLATVTYLFEGEIMHRDSIGSVQTIKPGAVNWMTAGRGIAHSERTLPDDRTRPHNAHGLQSWVALPKEAEDNAPEFFHHPADRLPNDEQNGVSLRVIAGEAFGLRAPVKLYSPLFYVEAHMDAGAGLKLTEQYRERAVYVIAGDVTVGGTSVAPLTMAVLSSGNGVHIDAKTPGHIILLGGEPLSEPRYIDWNFVSSDPEKIAAAKDAWRAQKFAKIPDDAEEFIPLP